MLATCLVLASGARAQVLATGADQSSTQPSELGEIVVTAQHREESIRDVPITMVAATGAQLEAAGVQDIRDLKLIAPGLSFNTPEGYMYPDIRGITTNFGSPGEDAPTAIYVDGVYQPNKLANLFDLPDVDRVEVLKGPQGTEFGRNAVAGAIAIYTLDPSFTPTGNVYTEAGKFFGPDVHTSGAYITKGFFSTPLVDNLLAASASIYFSSADGYLTDDRTGQGIGGYDKLTTRIKLLLEPSDAVKFVLAGTYGSTRDDADAAIQPGGPTVNSFYPGAIIPNRPWNVATEDPGSPVKLRVDRDALSLKGDFTIGTLGHLTSISAINNTRVASLDDEDAAFGPNCYAVVACLSISLPNQDSKTTQQEFDFASEKFGRVSFVAGIFYYREDALYVISKFNPPLNANDYVNWSGPTLFGGPNNTLTTSSKAAFAEIHFDATDKFQIIAGARYTWQSVYGVANAPVGTIGPSHIFPDTGPVSGSNTSPRLSFLYKLTPETNLYATYSKGYRSAFIDIGSGGNDVAQPETLNAYEVGLKMATSQYNLNVAAFYYDDKNLQVSFFLSPSLGDELSNAGHAQLYGLDVDGSVAVMEGWNVRGSVEYLIQARYLDFDEGASDYPPSTMGPTGMTETAVDGSGERMKNAPKVQASIGTSYTKNLSFGQLDLNATVFYSSNFKWDIVGYYQTPAYAIANSEITLTPTGSALKYGIFGRNLTNKAAITGGTPASTGFWAGYSPPREVGVDVHYSF
jgi:iron complex outermembrane recepter protein